MGKQWFDSFVPGLASVASFALALSLPHVALAEDPPALPAVQLDYAVQPPSPIQVGDRLELQARAGNPAQASTLDVEEGAKALRDAGFQVLAKERNRITVVPLKGGELIFPSLPIRSVASGETVARSAPFPIQVQSAFKEGEAKPDPLETLRPPVGLEFPWWVAAGIAALVLFLIGGILYALRRWSAKRRLRDSAVPVAPPKPEDEVALAALSALEDQQLLKKGEFKKHYFGISEIVKHYLGARFEFDAPECTSEELIRALSARSELGPQTIDQVQSLYDRLDRVKFTDHVPQVEEGAGLLESSRKLIRSTRRKFVSLTPEAAGGGSGR